MLITDHFFILLFFPAVFILHILIYKKVLLANILILLAGIYMYFTFGLWQLYMMIFFVFFDFFLGLSIYKTRNNTVKKIFLGSSITVNIAVLAFFKYSFFTEGAIKTMFPQFFSSTFLLTLPVGISFVTFQRISYLVDIYKKKVRPETNIIRYATYSSLFPHVVSGPIIRFSSIKDELKKRTITFEKVYDASKFFSLGFAFKILIADNLFILESVLTKQLNNLHVLESLLLILYFSFRVYFDFLGYSLMAIGLALFLGFHFPQNFNSPYQATSISDFWRRWNITLSQWLHDYVYIPLGGNRKGKIMTYRNLMITMLISGIWHGATLNFLLWGGIHGIFLIFERLFKNKKIINPPIFKRILVFGVISFSWVFFKLEFHQLPIFFSSLFSPTFTLPSQETLDILLYTSPIFVFAIIWSFFLKEKNIPLMKPTIINSLFITLLFLITLIVWLSKPKVFFIYYQF